MQIFWISDANKESHTIIIILGVYHEFTTENDDPMHEDPRLDESLTHCTCALCSGTARETSGRSKQKCSIPNTLGNERGHESRKIRLTKTKRL